MIDESRRQDGKANVTKDETGVNVPLPCDVEPVEPQKTDRDRANVIPFPGGNRLDAELLKIGMERTEAERFNDPKPSSLAPVILALIAALVVGGIVGIMVSIVLGLSP